MPNLPQNPPEDFLSLLINVAEDLSDKIKVSGQPGVYHREAEVDRVLQALASPLKGRVVLVGPARVGKTAVVEMVASRIITGQCPPELHGKHIWRLTPSSLVSSAPYNNWRGLFDQLMAQWPQHPEIILFLDEITSAARLPSEVDEDDERRVNLAMILAASLRRSAGHCLAEAEENAWQRFVDAYTQYEQVFLPVRIEETDPIVTSQIIRRAAEDLSILQNVTVTESALEQAFDLSQRYALDRAQPGKTIDLLRDSLAISQANTQVKLTADDVIARFGEQSGLPRLLLDDRLPFNEDEVLHFFKQRVLAQDQAVEAIVQSLSLLRARVHNPLRPMGVFLFLGPTGVGKTELARTLAEYLYGHSSRLVRFNMADYAGFNQHYELFGNPYNTQLAYRRGQLTNRLAGKMFAVIVLDEFEKAHRVIYQRFLQLFDEGLLINGNDEIINLRNSIFILTSNFGVRLVEHGRAGFPIQESVEAREKQVISETEQYFTPEFMNRIDAVCVFHPLTRMVMADIAQREINDLLQRDGLLRRQFEIDITEEVIEHVVELGYSPRYGARYLKRQIEKTITYPLARAINALPAEQAGGTFRLYPKHGRVWATYLPPRPTQPPPTGLTAPLPLPAITLAEIREALPVLAARLEALEELHGLAEAKAEQERLQAEMAEASFWNNQATARRKLDAYQRASSTVDLLSDLRQALDQLSLGSAAAAPMLDTLLRPYKFLLSELPRVEFTSWLSRPHDACGAYVQISIKSKLNAARQWASLLARMYLGWAKRRSLTASLLAEDQSPEGRTFTLTLVISGFGVYGLLAAESGPHRLIRTRKLSGKETLERLTATVSVFPELSDEELSPTGSSQSLEGGETPSVPEDLKITFKEINRSGLLIPRLTSQVTVYHSSADRRLTLTSHLPADDLTAEATRLLLTRLQYEKEPANLPAGGLNRTYITNTKDKGVHDHRTGQRTHKVKQVLEGDLQEFLDAALKQRGK